MMEQGFAAQLAHDLDPDDLRMVLGVFHQDVERLTGVLDGNVAAADVATFRRTCHALAGAAGAVGAVALEQACRNAMTRDDLVPAQVPAAAADIRALAGAALAELAAFLAALPKS